MVENFISDRMIRKGISLWIVTFLLLSNLLLVTPASATTVAAKIFSINFDGQEITWVDTNADGSLAFAALTNGSVIAMNNTGSVIYNVKPPYDSPIWKIVSDSYGNISYVKGTDHKYFGYLLLTNNPSNPVITSYAGGGGLTYNVTDVDIATNGESWTITVNPLAGGASTIYTLNPYTADLSYSALSSHPTGSGISNWSTIQYDYDNDFIVTGNISNNSVSLFNITNYTGWIRFNPTRATKNATQTLLDSFPYSANITQNNGATATVSYSFADCSTVTNISQISPGVYYYNVSTMGKYFLWANAYPTGNYNLSVDLNRQAEWINHSLYNETSKTLNITLNRSALTACVTAYFGNPTYTNIITANNYTVSNGTVFYQNITGVGANSWTAPPNVTFVNLTMYGGGGGGQGGGVFCGWGGGNGGSAAAATSTVPIKVTPGSSYTVTIGDGGAGGAGSTAGAGAADGSAGGTTSFNNGTVYSATGGAGGTGARNAYSSPAGPGGTGNTTTPGYPTASTGVAGRTQWCPCSGTFYPTTGGPGGSGYGAGGGGGGAESATCGATYGGAGGKGASGIVYISYYVNDIPKYMVGTAPTSSNVSLRQNVTISSYIQYVDRKVLCGPCNVTSLSIPEGGSTVAIGTSSIAGTAAAVYSVEVNSMGFGVSQCATSQAGLSRMIKSANGGTHYIEARSSEMDIYQLDGTLKGQYVAGGPVNSVDIADANGLWAIGGGGDGIVYIFSKATSSGWLVYYQGDSAAPINSVAMTRLGIYAAVGRDDGTFEYYSTQTDATTDNIFTANLFVNKGSVPYVGIPITITEMSGSVPHAFIQNITGETDSSGKYSFTAYDGRFYYIYINTNEYTQVYQGSSTYPTIAVNIPAVMITRPYQYASSFNTTAKQITSTYTDVNAADVNIKVIDSQSKAIISSRDYVGVTSVTDVVDVPYDNRSYKAVFNFTRTTGATYSDTIYLQSSIFNRIPQNTSDQNTLFIYAVYTIMLMVISLGIGMASTKYGVVMLVALTFAGILFGFLPMSLYTVGIATSAFIALLEVYRRHD